jgi:uncharacterized protein YbaA (DUF1428 family)
MPRYVDGFVIPVPKKNIKAYEKMAKVGREVWMDHGAIDYYECVGDDLAIAGMPPFLKSFKVKAGETAVFAFIVYKSRAHRDKVNAKVMKDPRLAASMTGKPPFDMKRMAYGGFKVLVSNAR